ncbi:MAG TPA: glycosyltransferase family 2 protein [Clostridia bacterium]|nr:glycosyltransferase family 2 protein [Clostridia bacterium]
MAVFLYWLGVSILFYQFFLYPLLLFFLSKLGLQKKVKLGDGYFPSVSLIITAYNEEKIIRSKLENSLALDYPKELLEIIVVSDCSTDQTDKIVKEYAVKGIKFLRVEPRGGKTNAQNQAVRMAAGEVICFSDANSMWEKNAVRRLVASFIDPKVAYVCGQLRYYKDNNLTRRSEGLYWGYEMLLRRLESALYSVTAGNGAIYAIRRKEFEEINPFYSHDLYYPQLVVGKGKLALYAQEAIAYEKSGANVKDEFSRRVRMFGRTWLGLIKEKGMVNPVKHGFLYSLMFFSHRLLRYILPFLLVLVFIAGWLAAAGGGWYLAGFLIQLGFYLLAILGFMGFRAKAFFFPMYFTMFAAASLWGLIRLMQGKVKPYWEQAASTRN